MRDYRNTPAYQLARGLVASVYMATEASAAEAGSGEPARERPRPVAALRRAAIAAAANLVAGSALPSAEEYLRALETARSALAELPRQVNLCQLRGHLPLQVAGHLLAEQAEASTALGRLIAEATQLAS